MIRGTHLPDNWTAGSVVRKEQESTILQRIKAISGGYGSTKVTTNEDVGLPPDAPETLENSIRKVMHRRRGK